jgi:hypothetical protein
MAQLTNRAPERTGRVQLASHPAGARISLGGPSRRAVLERALATLSELVSDSAQPRRVIV